MELIIEILIKNVGTLEINTKDMEEFGIPLTFNVSDIQDYASRKASFSKTIKVLGSTHNNIIFNHLYEIKGDNFNFDMTARHDCSLMVNKTSVIDGYMVLKEIEKIKIGDKFQVVYSLVIFDEAKNFFENISGKQLTDLDFSSGFTFGGYEYGIGDHILDEDRIYASMMYNNFTEVYNYPLLDYGYFMSDGDTFPYDYTITSNIVYPAVYVKPIIDKIFQDAGYTYTSKFLNGDTYSGMIKQMTIPNFKAIEYTDLHICEYVTDGGLVIDNNQYIPLTKKQNIMTGRTNWFYEIDNKVSFTTGLYYLPQAPVDGDYIITLRMQITEDRGGTFEIPYGITCAQDSVYTIFRSGSTYETVATYTTSDFRTSVYPDDWDVGPWYIEEEILLEDVKAEDYFYLYINPGIYGMEYEPPASPCRGNDISITLQGASLELTQKRELDDELEIYSGRTAPIVIADLLPTMDQSKFIRNLIKMFNLYIYSDSTDPSNLIIEPRDDFYKEGDIINWTEKVDYNKDIKIKTMNNVVANNMGFKHMLGEDYYSQQYENTWNETYGDKIIDLNNPYLKENKNVELDFQSYMMKNLTNDWNMPVLYESENYEHTFYDDRTDLDPFFSFIENKSGYLKLGNFETPTVRNGFITEPKVATHAKIMGGFSFDLNYETGTGYTFTLSGFDPDRGLYKLFWENNINDLIDDASRIVEMYCDLKLDDILNLNFKNRVLIDGQVYYLQKVEYDPSKINSSKITLIKEIDPIVEGSFETWYILKNDSGDYITGSDGDDGLGDNGDRFVIN